MLLSLIILYVLSLLYLSIIERFRHYVMVISLQGWLLLGVALLRLHSTDWYELAFVVAETLIFKALVLPMILRYVIRRTGINRVHAASVAVFNQLLLSMGLLLGSLVVTHYMASEGAFDRVFFGVALYALLSGMLLIITHKRIFSHLVGFLVIENGVFLFAMAIGAEMPYLVNIAILLDLVMSVLMLGLVIGRIGRHYHNFHVDSLNTLKD